MAAPPAASWTLDLADEAATARLGRDLAHMLRPGDLVTLSGGLGAGKTTLARSIIRRLAADEALEVPSPTFTLLQTYQTKRGTVAHADLYRIGSFQELEELGWEEASEGAVVLVEWPDRAGSMLPADRLDVVLELQPDRGETARRAVVTGYGGLARRLERLRDSRAFLEAAGWAEARRITIRGDASTRCYERLVLGDRTAILMDSPERSPGPAVRGGLAYPQIAKLALDVRPFVAVARGLKAIGLSAPEIYAADTANGFVLTEDLGAGPVVEAEAPIPERYERATDLLARLHGVVLPEELPAEEGIYELPRYDEAAMLIEVELLLDWYLPHTTARAVPDEMRAEFVRLWREALAPVLAEAATWTLRDYHSANLIWLADRPGIAAVGLIDFQDALLGPPGYDLVSLLQDARVDVSEGLEIHLLRRYLDARRRTTPDMDLAAFLRNYAILGAQRATKILGIFVRLAVRDDKPDYLRHIPRIERYLARDLAHPALADLAAWWANAKKSRTGELTA